MNIRMLFISSLSLIIHTSVWAEDSAQVERSWDFGFGLGFGEQTNPFIGADDVPAYASFDLSIYGKKFFFDNGDLGYTLIDRDQLGLNIITSYSSERIYYSYFNDLGLFGSGVAFSPEELSLDVVPLDLFSGQVLPTDFVFVPLEIPDRKFALSMGAELLYGTPMGQLQAQLLTDVSGVHNGTQLNLDLSQVWGVNRWRFKANIGVSWQSKETVDYYYGIDSNAGDFNISYTGRSTLNSHIGVLLSYRINNNISYVNQFKYSQLGSGITNSPLIEADNTTSYFSGLYYRF